MEQNLLFFNINFPKLPTKSGLEWPMPPLGTSTVAKTDYSSLTDDVNDLLSSVRLHVAFVILWTWNLRVDGKVRYSIHSDGRHDDPLQRQCAMNWNLSGDSSVEWWAKENCIPCLSHKDESFFTVTHWDYVENPRKLAEWDGQYPAVLNIRQPHSVKVISGPRKSITVRFKGLQSMQEMQEILKDYVIPVSNVST